MNLLENCTSKSWLILTLSFLFSVILPPANAQENVKINVGIANKLEVALAIGPTEVDYSTFEPDLRKILANEYQFNLPLPLNLIKVYDPPVPEKDLFVVAATAVSANTTSSFTWWVYDHNRPVVTYGGSSVINEAVHSYMEAPPWVTTSATGTQTTATSAYLSAAATANIWGPQVANVTIVNTVGETNYVPGIGYQYNVLGQTNPDPTNPDLAHYNTTSTNRLRHPYAGNNVHMFSSNNGSQMDFYGYPNYSYKDFRYLPNDQKTVKTFEFAIAEDAAYDALDGVGFFFNTHITETGYNSNSQRMSGYLLFLQYYFSGSTTYGGDGWVGSSDFKLGRGFKMTLYKFDDVDTKIFHHTNGKTETGNGALSTAVGGPGFTKIAENTTVYNAGIGTSASNTNPDFTRRIKIEVAPSKVKVWYVGSKTKNDANILNTAIDKNATPISWTILAAGALPASATLPAQNTGSSTPTVRLDPSIIKGYGFGPMASYVGHNCARPTHIALQNLSMTMDKVRSLTEVVREPNWQENTKKFLVNLNENEIEDFSSTSITGELLNRLRNDDIYYIGWCSDENSEKSLDFLKKNNLKGTIVNIEDTDAGTTTYEAQMKAIANEIYERYWIPLGNEDPVVLVTDQVDLDVTGADKTNTTDPMYPSGKWKIVHSYDELKNNDGVYPLSGQFVSDLDLQFNRVGIYEIYYREEPIITITAHKAPVAAFSVTLNGNKPTFTDESYDPDEIIVETGKTGSTTGIESFQWSYVNIEEDDAKLVEVQSIAELEAELAMLLLDGKTYLVILDVVDKYGATASIAKQIRYVASNDPEAQSAVIGVTVTPASVSIKKGNTQQFAAILTIQGSPSESVEWSISSDVPLSSGTFIDQTGLLTVDANETAAELIVTATSDFNKTKQGTASVTLSDKSVESKVIAVTVTPQAPTIEKGKMLQFTANVATQGGALETVVWSIPDNVTLSPGTFIDQTGLLTVDANETVATFTVKATSTYDPKKDGIVTVTVVDPPAVISVDVIPSTVEVRQGITQTQQFTAIVTVKGKALESVVWSVLGNVSANTIIDPNTGKLTVDESETDGTILTVTATSVFDISKNDEAKVTITSAPVTSTVIAVTVSPSAPSVNKGTTQQFVANVATQGGASDAVVWKVSGIGASSKTSIDPATGLLTIDPDETAETLTVTATSSVGAKIGTATVSVTESPFEPPFANFDIYPYSILKGVGNQNITLTNNSYDLQGLPITSVFTLTKDENPIVFPLTEGSNDFSTLGVGNYAITLVVNNGYKNSAPVKKTFSIVEDIVPPTASTPVSSDGFTKNTPIVLTFSDTGGSGFKEQRVAVTNSTTAPATGDDAWKPWSASSSRSVTINQAGINYIHWEATDYAGNSSFGWFGPYTLTKQSPPTLTLTASPQNEATYPDAITLTAEFDISAFGPLDEVPTGYIIFYVFDGINKTRVEPPVLITQTGEAELIYEHSVTPLPIGIVTFSAEYGGNSNYDATDASLLYTINKNATATISVGAQTDKTYDGDPFEPTGITIAEADATLYEVKYEGRDGTIYNSATPPTDAGKYSFIVTTTDPRYVPKSASVNFEIYKRELVLSLSANPSGTANAMSDVTLTTTVDNLVDVPAGKVKFSQGGTQIGSDTAIDFDGDYQAILTWTSVPEGVYNLKAEYIAAGNDNYTATADATISGYTVVKQNQTGFGFTDESTIVKSILDDDFIITANGGQTLGSVTYEVTEGLDVVSVDEFTGEVTILGLGTAVITATKPGNDVYHPAVATLTITVVKDSNVSATIGTQTDKVYDAVPFVVTGILVTEGIGYELKYEGRDGTIYDSSNSPVNAGKYTVTVTTTDPNFVEKTASADFEIYKRELALSLSANPSGTANAMSDVALAVTVSNAVVVNPPAGKIKFSIDNVQFGTDVAIDNSYQAVVTWSSVPEGIYVLKAEYIAAADDNYTVAGDAIINNYTVVKQEQTGFGFISDANPITKWLTDDDFYLEVDGELSSGVVTYTVTEGSDVVSVDPITGKVRILKEGTAVITVSISGDEMYKSAEDQITITVSIRPSASVTVVAENKYYDGLPFNPIISVKVATLYETIYIGRDGTIYDSATPPTNPGKYMITVTTAADPNYIDVSFSTSFEIFKLDQPNFDFTDSSPIIKWITDNNFDVIAEGGLSSNSVIYTVTEGSDVISVDPQTGAVTIIGSGTAVITATQNGDDIYNDAVVTTTIVVNKHDDAVVTIGFQTDKPYDGEPFDPKGIVVEGADQYEVTYTGRDGTTYSSKTPPTKPGKYTVTVTTTDPMYEEKIATADFEIFKLDQPEFDFNFSTSEPKHVSIDEGSIILQVEGAKAGTIIYSVTEGGEFVSVNPQTGEVTILGIGTAVINVTISGDDIYNPAVASLTLVVGIGSEITDIMIDNKVAPRIYDNTFSVVADCGKDKVTIKVNADPSAIVEFNNLAQREQMVNLPNYGDNVFDIKVTLQGNKKEYTLIVVRNYDHVEYEYYDVPTINCNVISNGGYVFNAFQWYQNDVAISGTNKPYYRITNANDTYWCEITLSTNEKWKTCIIRQNQRQASILSAYPNPTQGQVTISNHEQVSTGKIQVFDMYGRIVLQSYDNPLDMSGLPEGVYLIKINDETVRVVLKR